MASQEERKAETRLKIINSANKLFEHQGVDATSVEQIFTKANVSKGTFYKHFKTKLDVLIAVGKEEAREITRHALQDVAEGADALSVMKRYMEMLATWFEQRENIAEAMVLTQLAKSSDTEENIDPEISTSGFIYRLLVSAQEQGNIRRDVDAKQLAEMVGGFIVVQIIIWSRTPLPGKLASTLKKSLTVFLDGAKHGVEKS